MKKILWGLIALIGLASCEDSGVEDVFDKSPEKRVDEQLTELRKSLQAEPYGWSATYLFRNGRNAAYFAMEFLPGEENRVKIKYEDDKRQVQEAECSYSLRYTQQIELVFDTYSPLAMLVGTANQGDFRFSLDTLKEGSYTFKAFNDATNGEGYLYLNRANDRNSYERIQSIRKWLRNDGNKSFYRLIQLDDSDMNYMYHYSVGAMITYLENGEVKTIDVSLEINDDGARCIDPLILGGHHIDYFLLNPEDSSFSVMEKGEKIGILDYSKEKPFSYPNAVQLFMDEIGADESNIMIAPIALSQRLNEVYELYQKKTPDFLQWVIEPCLNWMVFFHKTDPNAGIAINTTYGEDWISFEMVGLPRDNNAWHKAYYEERALELINSLVWSSTIDGGMQKVFSIFPFNGYFYFVRNDDPTIFFVGKPQFRDA